MNAGPYQAEADTRPVTEPIWEAFHAAPRARGTDEACYRLMRDAADAAGVEVGAFDDRILRWLSGFEPSTCAVVAGLITRAAVPRGLVIPGGYVQVFAALLHDGIEYAESLPPNTRGRGQAGLYRAMARAMNIRLGGGRT